MMQKSLRDKRGVMGQVVGVFLLVLVLCVIVGMIFLFVAQLKENVQDHSSQRTEVKKNNETLITVTEKFEQLFYRNYSDVSCTIVIVTNATTGVVINSGNYTQSNCEIRANGANFYNNTNWNVSYVADYASGTGFLAVNKTEKAGSDLVDYLPLVFLALIFGAILIVVLRVILPYLNIGSGSNFGSAY